MVFNFLDELTTTREHCIQAINHGFSVLRPVVPSQQRFLTVPWPRIYEQDWETRVERASVGLNNRREPGLEIGWKPEKITHTLNPVGETISDQFSH